ncbi:DUF4145 domain-containing protein [Paracidovorax avenae]|uniref:DUF4145 domain-containing protein n=1 Tax=Paracidovorax avenae TaxID=80867 RepID=UPI000D214F4E|nr:DUF4145 domain-containing protein [Paracidovorax avenae]AVS86278.1 ABC transporter substrate-binding protein [Paracidovorax avenae]AVT11030.1 ABC transporter substrate-binding protein [Paracidovorax avenae]
MDRRALKFPFTLSSAPDWTCPRCEKAPLRIKTETFSKEEQYDSRDHSHEAWEPDWIQYVYSCLLICSNDQCKEVVASSGTGTVDWNIYEDEDGIPDQIYEDHFRPKFFQPHLKLFPFPKGCPDSVTKPLEDSFSLFFSAPHAASNNVRISIESLLTDLKIRRFNLINGKRRFISLHQRIALLPPKYSHLKDLILAIKWLGNAGSHDNGTEVTLDDVMDSYELTEHILQEVYAPKLANLQKIAKKVNKKKGPAK